MRHLCSSRADAIRLFSSSASRTGRPRARRNLAIRAQLRHVTIADRPKSRAATGEEAAAVELQRLKTFDQQRSIALQRRFFVANGLISSTNRTSSADASSSNAVAFATARAGVSPCPTHPTPYEYGALLMSAMY